MSPETLGAEFIERLRPNPDDELPMVRQLYLTLYEAITQGDLPDAHRLPASRELAARLGIARNTVVAVYQQLTDEGLLSSQGRSGTRVSYKIAMSPQRPKSHWRTSDRSRTFRGVASKHRTFAPGQPDPGLFPADAWRRALQKAAQMPAEMLAYQERPVEKLQNAIARYLAVYRSLNVAPEQILITSSTRQSLVLAANLFADTGDLAWVETPGYTGAVDAFETQGLELLPCPVDDDGLIPSQSEPPRIIYVTPCFQYPLGVTLSPARRQQLLEMSTQHGTVIFEDDYDTEFRDDSLPRPAMAANDTGARVLNAGTFSKLIFPAVRVAWLVLPSTHIAAGYRGLKAVGGCDNSVNQFAVAELLENGTIATHLKRARQVYSQRSAVLVDSLRKASELESEAATGGLCLVVTLKHGVPLAALTAALNDAGIGATPYESLQWERQTAARVCKKLVLGLGNIASLDIPEATNALDKAVRKARR